ARLVGMGFTPSFPRKRESRVILLSGCPGPPLPRGDVLDREFRVMDLRFTAEELAFRDEVRAFFRLALPDGIRDKLVANKGLSKDDIVTWQRILNAKGWAVANWPVERGGTGWTPVQQYMFQEELQMTPAPQPLGFGVTMVGPV